MTDNDTLPPMTPTTPIDLAEQHDTKEAGEAEEEVKLAAGTAVIVPRGRWHRIELDTPSDIMSVTVRGGSRLERRA